MNLLESLRGKHIISASQFTDTALLSTLFDSAEEMEARRRAGNIPQTLSGKLFASLFYEPSTRTRFSFEAAAKRLGADVLTTENAAQFSSAVKGESLEDSIRIMNSYADAIVLRHPEKGASARAARVSGIPIINAGDGAGEHPTQALLDLYTIRKARGRIEGAKVAFVGDLRYGRTVHSLLTLLALYQDISPILISPQMLALPEEYRTALDAKGIAYEERNDMEAALAEADVLYMTRIQKERFAEKEEYEKLKDLFILTEARAEAMKPDALILHPLPRNNEIAPEVDENVRAHYFAQAQNGLYLRMALLAAVSGN